MIVKDEAAILPRLFDSCRELLDYWVICDTGSTDGTQELIRRELDGIPGELHQREWVNFGVNRGELAELARGKSDYLLLLDADMTIRQVAPIGALTAGAYLLRQSVGDFEYRNKRLVRGDLEWHYVGSTHEYIESADGAETVEQLDAVVVDHHADGHSWSDKFERDMELLTQVLRENPTDARAQFYLAQTCRDLAMRTENKHMLANAADHYQRRAEMPGWAEETYFAQYQVGALAAQLGDWPRAMDAYVRAWEGRPQRLEALHGLAVGLREHGYYHAAHRFTRMASHLKPLRMPDDVLFVAPWVYEWGVLFEYSITAYWVGEFRNSFAACKKLLSINSVPDEYRKLTITNVQHALRETTRIAAERPRRERKLKHAGTPTRGLPAR
jgi:tetratricopeptide (TPR) repeat protein